MKELFVNKSNRLRGYDYNLPGAYFITICLKYRKCLFGDIINGKSVLNKLGSIAENCWMEIPNHFEDAESGPFVIMPNHIHGIIYILEDCQNIVNQTYVFDSLKYSLDLQNDNSQIDLMHSKLSTTIGSYKSSVTKEINRAIKQPRFKWQTSFHDHIIRNENEMQNIANYIELNPANWADDFENEKYRASLSDKERKTLLKELYKQFSV